MSGFVRIVRICLFCALLSFSVVASSSKELALAPSGTTQLEQEISAVIDSYVANQVFSGVVLVEQSGQVIFQRAYGVADQDKEEPISLDSAFQIASLSKPITATLVLMLEEQGKLKLDDTLAKYFPEFDHDQGNQITLDHLLSHRSGIPNHFVIDGWHSSVFHKETSEEAFIKMISELSLTFKPGDDYLYSNPGYFLLGKIIEQVTRQPFENVLEQQIFTPLNMTHSGVSKGEHRQPYIVKPYQWDIAGGYRDQTLINMRLFGAGAAIYATASDLAKFNLALQDNRLLSDKSRARLFDVDKPYSWRVGSVPIEDDHPVTVHNYDGQIDGYSSMLTYIVEGQQSIILLSNTGINYQLKQQLTWDIAAILLGFETESRDTDMSLKLINSIVSGKFEQGLKALKATSSELDEEMLTSIAYQLLWSGLAEPSIQLFHFISQGFNGSVSAKGNLANACQHRLTSEVPDKFTYCTP